ncbi:MAG TPA: DUF883 family protein [Burkholderiales bacterium]|nr:DUF883 family protein [Burkholderiales bacterium]
MDSSEVTKEKLAADLKLVINDAEELLRATASQAGEKVTAARLKVQDSLDQAKVKLSRLSDAGLDKAKEAARVTDDFVHDQPWTAVGIGAGLGLILGLLIGRR